MTERLYYTDSFLSEFDATVAEVRADGGRTALVLDRTAFYPTSGGQVFDTGVLRFDEGQELQVLEVAEDASGEVLHFVDDVAPGSRPAGPVHGVIDFDRRRDHMQQHSGQHVLSAAFVRLFYMQTVSFHMGEESCTIDLDARSLTDQQVREAELEANRVVLEDRQVEVRFASVDEARALGVRKIPDHVEGELRLIDMEGYDLNACGGTHVRSTGQIGAILLRKTEKVKQGVRVEFVCGERAVGTARRDYEVLTEAAGVLTTHIGEVPQQVRKSLEEIRAAGKERKKLLEELAGLQAAMLLGQAESGVIARVFADRDIAYVKLLAQKITIAGRGSPVVALLGAAVGQQAGFVFAQTAGGPSDMGALMKEAMAATGGRGGGTRDMAQGGAPAGADLQRVIHEIAAKVRG